MELEGKTELKEGFGCDFKVLASPEPFFMGFRVIRPNPLAKTIPPNTKPILPVNHSRSARGAFCHTFTPG